MINASEFSDLDQQSFDKNFDILFPNTSLSSPVSIVRIATHLKNLDVSLKLSYRLKSLGYTVALNLMNISSYSYEFITRKMNYISADIVDIIYFADSYGNLLAEDVASLINLFKSIWNQSLGFHAHDNTYMALAML